MSDPLNAANSPPSSATSVPALQQLSSGQWFLRGTLSERSALVASRIAVVPEGNCISLCTWCRAKRGSFAKICVPKAWQQRIRQAVNDYRLMQKLIEEVSELEWKRLQEKKR